MITFFKKPIVITTTVIVVLVAGFIMLRGKDTAPQFDFIIAKRADILREVNVTGRVKPSESVDLAFEKTGKVESISVGVGDRVFIGQILVKLESDIIEAELIQARANVKIQQAKLDELVAGPTIEEIEVQKVKVKNAEASFADAEKNLITKLQDGYTKSDDAVRNKADQFISNPQNTNPQINFTVNDSRLKTSIEGGRVLIESMLAPWQEGVRALSLDSNLTQATLEAKQNLNIIKTFLDDVSFAVNALKTSTNFSQATIDGYRADVSTARTNIDIALSVIVTAEEKLKDAESALFLEKEKLVLEQAGTRIEQIIAQEAKTEEVQGVVAQKQAELGKTVLWTPINGVITKQETNVGEIVSANTVIVSLISTSEFQIEANVPEADIAKISINDKALVTLDAYGSDVVFEVRVVSIEPAETIIEGVATYKTIFQFVEKDDRVFSGMTANIDIKSGERKDVVVVPARAVIIRNGNKVVRVFNENDTIIEVHVITGFRGSNGSIEIIEGIQEGDKVVTFIEE